MANLLEATLAVAGAEKHLVDMNNYCVDASVLPLLSAEDLKTIGVEDKELINNIIKQSAKLPLDDELILDLTVEEKYVLESLNAIDQHLVLLNAGLSYATHTPMQISTGKLSDATRCLLSCTKSFSKTTRNFYQSFAPKEEKGIKWKYAIFALMSATASLYMLKKFVSS